MRSWTTAILSLSLALIAASGTAHAKKLVQPADEPPGRIERFDLKTDAASTKVIVMLSRPLAFKAHVFDGEAACKSTRRLVLDFENTTLAPEAASPIEVDDGLVQRIRTGQPMAGTARVVLDLASKAKHSVEAYEDPPHVTITITDSPPTK